MADRQQELGAAGRSIFASGVGATVSGHRRGASGSPKTTTGRRMTKRQISEGTYKRNTPDVSKSARRGARAGSGGSKEELAGVAAMARSPSAASASTTWAREEDVALREAVKQLGTDRWDDVAQRLSGRRSAQQCQQRWKKALRPGIVRGTWSAPEDEVLLSLIKAHQDKGLLMVDMKWQDVAEQIPGRNAKQCRERWFLNLDPSIKRGPWTEEEDQLLLELSDKLNKRWSQIARGIEGRTENNVKTRYHSLMRTAARSRPWTPAEDAELKRLALLHALDWGVIAASMPQRSRQLLKKRFSDLCKGEPELARRANALDRSGAGSCRPSSPSGRHSAAAAAAAGAGSRPMLANWQTTGGASAGASSAMAHVGRQALRDAASSPRANTQVLQQQQQQQQQQYLHDMGYHGAGPAAASYVGPSLVAVPPPAAGGGAPRLRRSGNSWLSSFGSSGGSSSSLDLGEGGGPPELMRVQSHTVLTDLMDGVTSADDDSGAGHGASARPVAGNSGAGAADARKGGKGGSSSTRNAHHRTGSGSLRLPQGRNSSMSSGAGDGGVNVFGAPAGVQRRATPPPLGRSRHDASAGMLDRLLGMNSSLDRSSSSLDLGSEEDGAGGALFAADSPPTPKLPPPGTVLTSETPSMSLNPQPWSSMLPASGTGNGSAPPLPRAFSGDLGPFVAPDDGLPADKVDKRRRALLRSSRSSSEMSNVGKLLRESSITFDNFLKSMESS